MNGPDLSFLEPPSKPGTLGRLAHYEVLQVLGQDNDAIVLKAFDEKLQRTVAIKVLGPQLADNTAARERFVREAQSAAAVRSKHVVAVFDVVEEPLSYLVMEFVSGRTLQEQIASSGPLAVPDIVRIGAEVAEGLAAAHGQGVVHGDLRPANILLVNDSNSTKVTNFGQARAVPAGDLFGLGSVLYLLCTGQPPFPITEIPSDLKHVLDATPRPVQEINAAVPGWLGDLIGKLLSKEPAERFQTATEVVDLLRQHQPPPKEPSLPLPLEEKEVIAAFRHPVAEGPSGQAQPEDTRTHPGWSAAPGSRFFRWIGGGVLGLVVLGLLWLFLLRPGKHQVSGNQEPRLPPPPARAPFDAEQARAHQEAWARYLDTQVETTNSLGMTMILIPPGEFLMWASAAEIEEMRQRTPPSRANELVILQSEGPQHPVVLTRPFMMAAHSLTLDAYRRLMGDKAGLPSRVDRQLAAQVGQCPIRGMTWLDGARFCNRLSEHEGLEPCYLLEDNTAKPIEGNGYRYPNEAEWEFACRAGTTTRYFHGDTAAGLDEYARFAASSTIPAGQLKPNPFGLFDLVGNAGTWCQDSFDLNYYKSFGGQPAIDPQGPAGGKNRVQRGGFYGDKVENLRSARRWARPEDAAGFSSTPRLVRTVELPVAEATQRSPGGQ